MIDGGENTYAKICRIEYAVSVNPVEMKTKHKKKIGNSKKNGSPITAS